MQNIEFKAELRDVRLARAACQAHGATLIGIVEQTDTYYRLTNGRLKKREADGEPVEYIFYARPDRLWPKASHFKIYSENEALERFGRLTLPVWVVVRKVREVMVLGNVRIHFDQVEGLGEFIELEAMVTSSQSAASCREAVEALRADLAPALGEPIACSYSDLVAAGAA